MECERLKRQIKNWYIQVQDEEMAPARMVDFMRQHIAECMTCLADSIVEMEVNRITEIVLPPSKIPKAVRKEEKKADAPSHADEEVGPDKEATSEDVDSDDTDDDDVDADDEDEDDEI